MEVVISFDLNGFSTTEKALLFVLEHLHFVPKAINSAVSYKGGYDLFEKQEAVRLLKENNDNVFRIEDDLYIDGDDARNSVLFMCNSTKNLQYFFFKFDYCNPHWLNHLINDAHKIGFFMAFQNDFGKSSWQDTLFFSNFQAVGKSYAHLNLKTHWDETFSPIYNKEVIDVFQNPGHSVITYGTWLMAAPEIWFSKNAWSVFNKEHLKEFEQAIVIEEQANDLLYIKLFDAQEPDYETKEIMDIQSSFRKFSGMNEVEKILEKTAMESMKANGTEKVIIQKNEVNE